MYKDLFDSFPYRNTIDLVELSGVDLMKGLQVSGFLQMKGKIENLKFSIKECFTLLTLQTPITDGIFDEVNLC